MEALENILTRRSIRSFTDKEISSELIDKLLEAAVAAPSAGNQQPWNFIVVDDKSVLKQITEYHPSSKMLNEASHAIVVCGDLHKEKHPGYWIEDCSAATQNILLAAHALGLGAVWLGVYPVKERVENVIRHFKLPENILPLSIIALGYTDVSGKKIDRYKADIIHYNKW